MHGGRNASLPPALLALPGSVSHTVPHICDDCPGPEDFPAYVVCLLRYPIPGCQQAHPALVPGAREPDGRCAPDRLQVLTPQRYSSQVPSLCSEAPASEMRLQCRLCGERGWMPGAAWLLAVGSGGEWSSPGEPSPAPACFLVLPQPPRKQEAHHPSPSFPEAVMSLRDWDAGSHAVL